MYHQIAEHTGIPPWRFALALGQSVTDCSINTVAEAHHVLSLAPRGSRSEATAYARWEELSAEAIKNAQTPEQVLMALQAAPPGSEVVSSAFGRWEELVDILIDTARTLEDAQAAYECTSDHDGHQALRARAQYKWDVLADTAVTKISTLEAAKYAYEHSRHHSHARQRAFRIYNTLLCIALKDAGTPVAVRELLGYASHNSEAEILGEERMRMLYAAEVASAASIEALQAVFHEAREFSEVQDAALAKIVTLFGSRE